MLRHSKYLLKLLHGISRRVPVLIYQDSDILHTEMTLYSKNWFCVLGSQNNPGHLQHDLSASPGNWIYPYDFLINLTYTTFKCIHSTVDCQLLQEPPMFAKEALCRYVLQINTLWYRVSNVVCSAQLPWLEILCKQYSCCVRSQLSKEKLGLLGLDV